MSTDILPGDWWFIRQQRIPLKSESANTTDSSGTSSQSHGSMKFILMRELSEKAARTCFHLHNLHLAGVRQYLAELQATQETQGFTGQDREGFREMFDFGKGKEWTSRFKKEPHRWTLDFGYKFGVLRNVWEPAPPLLDWASCMTWLTMNQAAVPGGSLPLDYFLYSVCAVELCSKLNPVDVLSSQNLRSPEHSKWVKQFKEWQVKALTHAHWYLNVPRPLLSQKDRNELQRLLTLEPAVFFSRAATASDQIRKSLIGWGVQL